LLHSGTPWAAR
jgi:hypothetical protein